MLFEAWRATRPRPVSHQLFRWLTYRNKSEIPFLLALASYLLVYHGKLDSYDGKLLEHLCAVVCYSIPCKFSKDENGKVAFSFHFSCSLGTSAIATRTHLIKSPVQRTFVS